MGNLTCLIAYKHIYLCVHARKAMPEIDKAAWKMIEIWKADKLNLYNTTCKLMIWIEISFSLSRQMRCDYVVCLNIGGVGAIWSTLFINSVGFLCLQ